MSGKRLVPRALALRDVDEVVAHYADEGGRLAALRFIDALEKTFSQIGRYPAAGSPRYALKLNLPGLRCVPVGRYPHLVFYVERDAYIDVWRVLHGERDIPAWMHSDERMA